MISSEVFSINVKGESGKVYDGNFTVKMSMTRSEKFKADQIRREILGPSPVGQEAPPALQTEAYILGQLAIRLLDAPEWWVSARNGLDIEDYTVILTVYDKILELDEKLQKDRQVETDKALKELEKKDKAKEKSK